jgi:hypothetical protein
MHIIWVGSGLYQTSRKKRATNALAYFTAMSAAKKRKFNNDTGFQCHDDFLVVPYEEAK